MNFYDRLKAVCEEKGKKITAAVVESGGNKGSIMSWKNGSVPNYAIVDKLADTLDTNLDFLMGKEDIELQPRKYFKSLEVIFASKYKYINLSSLSVVTEEELGKYAAFLNCSKKFMYNRTSTEFVPEDKNRTDVAEDITIDIIDVMSFLPGSDDVRFLQIQISRVVIYNLETAGYDRDSIKAFTFLNTANRNFLLSGDFDYAKKKAYGFTSDELRSLHRATGLSYKYLFSGIASDGDREVIRQIGEGK